LPQVDKQVLYTKLGTLATISTGSKAMDALLGGGVRTGMLTDIYGESGSGKSQLCFTLCANCVRDGSRAIFVDTAGTFRPERIVEMSSSPDALDRITLVRALATHDQTNAVKKIAEMDPRLVIVDTATSLFSVEYSGPARHLAVMRHLHELALAAINTDCAVVITNMVRNAPITVVDQAGRNVAQAVIPSQQREYLGSSVSIYSHMKLKLEIVNAAKSSFQAILVQPAGKEPVRYTITPRGISDAD
jgi:RecA/RadA recombinase